MLRTHRLCSPPPSEASGNRVLAPHTDPGVTMVWSGGERVWSAPLQVGVPLWPGLDRAAMCCVLSEPSVLIM